MADLHDKPASFSLRRWSQRKLEASREASAPAAEADRPVAKPAATVVPEPVVPVVRASAPPEPAPLPPVETLTIDSDFTAFLRPKVDAQLKQAALRRLFSDPRFNVMDGLDIYIGDYTQADPMPAGMLDQLAKVYDAIKVDLAADADAAAVVQAKTEAAIDASTSPDAREEVAAIPASEPGAAAAAAPEGESAQAAQPQADTAIAGSAGVHDHHAPARDTPTAANVRVLAPGSPERQRS